MRLRISLRAATLWAVSGLPAQDAWLNILGTVNLTPELGAPVILPREAGAMDPAQLRQRVEQGAVAILEGASPAAERFGIRPAGKNRPVRSITDLHHPKLSIVWRQAAEVPHFELPPEARVFTTERSSGAPLAAGLRLGNGAVLWLAVDPGPSGHERFPYLLHALRDLGLVPPLASQRLWVFLDTSYRLRADPDYMAKRWRRDGISALHLAAWHYFEPDRARDEYLGRLIGACHKNAILVYAWLELPHVSDAFWNAHPEWREKTASGVDAHLDWRKLMNLLNPDCVRAVRQGTAGLVERFDWDGVNLAELYFESLEGHANPSRFTPLNEDVRREFRERHGFDPAGLFDSGSARHWQKDGAALRQFLEYRVKLAQRIEQEWISFLVEQRRRFADLDLVLTHVDNLLEPETRDRIGADARAALPLADRHDFTFLIEDPATAWSLGPQRYSRIGQAYAPHAPRPGRLAIDINVVERYQDVYPTKQQTGVELFRELHLAGAAFPRVTLYSENSVLAVDWPLAAAAVAAPRSLRREAGRVAVNADAPIALLWQGNANVNGRLWPALNGSRIWLPPGEMSIEPANQEPPVRLLDLNADLKHAAVTAGGLDFVYESAARALAILSRRPAKLFLDGEPVEPKLWVFEDGWVLVLPKGQHVVGVIVE
ncbi:MAG: hypothetical protein HY235_00955 [Acidobacteria bacterium]|nr:hypothetical protein [Acidobacteriota bacterium]